MLKNNICPICREEQYHFFVVDIYGRGMVDQEQTVCEKCLNRLRKDARNPDIPWVTKFEIKRQWYCG